MTLQAPRFGTWEDSQDGKRSMPAYTLSEALILSGNHVRDVSKNRNGLRMREIIIAKHALARVDRMCPLMQRLSTVNDRI